MATVSETVKNMNDTALKPRILRTLLKEDVPDEKKPSDCPSKLSRVVSAVQTLNLLSESYTDKSDDKLIQRWKSAVDEWNNRILSLVSNASMPDKCWAGVCLLGVTCQQCSSERFLASYAVWFDKILFRLQSPEDPQFVKVASCTSMADIITRLGGFLNMKKDGTSLAGKVIQPVLKLLKEENSDSVLEVATHLLCIVVTFFPAALHRHYDSVEDAITERLLPGKCSVNLMKKLAHCLALLPKSRGDEDSWVLLMRKILLLVNGYLTEIFSGLEEETKWDEAVRLLFPPSEVPPDRIWGQILLEDTSNNERKRSKLLTISILMFSCSTMLSSSYPVQVTIPIRSLLALVERVMMVDGSLPRSSLPFVIVTEQEFICSELPALHSHSLDLLASVIKGMRSQLLPHASYIVRLVKDYFRRCELAELRKKLYSITKMLLVSMGVGIAIYLSQEVVNNALRDLNPISDDSSSSTPKTSLFQSSNRKRKHGATVSSDQQHELQVEMLNKHQTAATSVQIAALEALESLLTVGGALRSESWRSKVDHTILTIATDCCKGGWANERKSTFLSEGTTSYCADLQLAALRAFLASLLSPSRVCPPHLAQGLELFRRGRQETGTKISEFCAHALLALELLIHPRALPLVDFPSAKSFNNQSFPDHMNFGDQKYSNSFLHDIRGAGYFHPDSDDDLYESWLGSSKDTDAPKDLDQPVVIEKPAQTFVQRVDTLASYSAIINPGRNEPELATPGTEVVKGYRDEIMDERQHLPEPLVLQEPTIATIPLVTSDPEVSEMELTNTVALDSTEIRVASVVSVLADKNETVAARYENLRTTSQDIYKDTAITFTHDNNSDEDSIPDIVEADPDSD